MLEKIEQNWGLILSASSPEELLDLIWVPANGHARYMGTRSLVARTCHKCCLLKSAEDFRQEKKTGYWSSVCTSCKVTTLRGTDHDMKRVQDETLDRAVKRYEPYTGADMEIIAREDLTVKEKAILLGRSYYGVATMLKKYREGEHPTIRRLTEGHPL